MMTEPDVTDNAESEMPDILDILPISSATIRWPVCVPSNGEDALIAIIQAFPELFPDTSKLLMDRSADI